VLKFSDFEVIVITTTNEVSQKRLEFLLPHLAAEGIFPTIITSEPNPNFPADKVAAIRQVIGDRANSLRYGAWGCLESHIKAARSSAKPIIVLEDDVKLVSNFKKRLQQEVLAYLPDDWICCFAGAETPPNPAWPVLDVNEMIIRTGGARLGHIILWNSASKLKETCLQSLENLEYLAYSRQWTGGFLQWAFTKDIPAYTTRLKYGKQLAGDLVSGGRLTKDSLIWGQSSFECGVQLAGEGKLQIERLEFPITSVCNLSCKECFSYSTVTDWTIVVEDVFESLKLAHQYIRPKIIGFSGGEPLCHPQIAEIIEETLNVFPYSEIHIYTNGTLFSEKYYQDMFLALESKYPKRIWLMVSVHLSMPVAIDWILKNWSRKAIISHYKDALFKPVATGEIKQLYQQEHDKAAIYCCSFVRKYHGMIGTKLYGCVRAALRCQLAKFGLRNGKPINQQWAAQILSYDGIALESSSPMEIREYLLNTRNTSCSLCVTHSKFTKQKQLSDEEEAAYLALFSG